MGETTELTVVQRAALAVGSSQHETKLIELAKVAQAIKAITNKDGYSEAHATRMTLKNTRLAITKTSKDARDDATAFSKAVIAEEKRLIGIISPEEERIEQLQKAWDDAIEAEKQRKIDEERARLQAIKDQIEELRRFPVSAAGASSEEIRRITEECSTVIVDELFFAEHTALAAMAKAESLTALAVLLDKAIEAEAEAERVRLERIELEALREKQRIDDQVRAEQDRIAREQEAARMQEEREASNRKAAEAEEALRKQREESDRLSRELEALRKANEERVTTETANIAIETANTAAQIAADEEQEERSPVVQMAAPWVDTPEGNERPSNEEIIQAIAEAFDVTNQVALDWILEIQFFTEPGQMAA